MPMKSLSASGNRPLVEVATLDRAATLGPHLGRIHELRPVEIVRDLVPW